MSSADALVGIRASPRSATIASAQEPTTRPTRTRAPLPELLLIVIVASPFGALEGRKYFGYRTSASAARRFGVTHVPAAGSPARVRVVVSRTDGESVGERRK